MDGRLTLQELERLPYLRSAMDEAVEKIYLLEARKTAIKSGWPSGEGKGNRLKGIDDILASIQDQEERIRNSLQPIRNEWYNTSVKISQIRWLRIRLIVSYRFDYGLSWQEVADKLGTERDTEYSVKSAFNRWMKRQEALSQE